MKAFILDHKSAARALATRQLEEPRRPLFGVIAHTGGSYSIDYAKSADGSSAHLSGYSLETFDRLPDETPVIDYQSADPSKVMKMIFAIEGIFERDILHCMSNPAKYVHVDEYLRLAAATGATITTAGEIRSKQPNQ